MACYGTPGVELDDGPAAYMDYECTPEQVDDDTVVKCCLRDDSTSYGLTPLDDTAEPAPDTCDGTEELLGPEERCCPAD